VLFCARPGKADRTITKIQIAAALEHAAADWNRMADIAQILYPFFADCRLSFRAQIPIAKGANDNFDRYLKKT